MAEDLVRIPHIPFDRFQDDILAFVSDSALQYCTEIQAVPGDAIAVIPTWPVDGFSGGERAAWDLLQSMVSGELRKALDTVDATNLAALARVFAGVSEGAST